MANKNSLRANIHPYDPSDVPPAVRRAAEAADRIQAEAIAAQTQPVTLPAPALEPTIQIANPPPAPAEPAPPTVPATPPTEPPAKLTYEEMEHQLRSALGRDKSQRAQITALTERVDSLQNVIETMQSAPVLVTTAPLAPAMESLITKEDRDNYGEDMIELIGRKAQEIAGAQLAPLQNELASLKQRLEGTSTVIATNAHDRMLAALDERCPTWKQINFDNEFISWLGLPDLFSGAKRQELLLQAWEKNDTARVLAFFNGFLSEKAALAPATETTVLPVTPQPDRPSLESFAAPGRARTSASIPAPDEKPFIKTSEITAFYASVRKGAYAGKDEEKDRLEQMIFSAQQEGRVIVG